MLDIAQLRKNVIQPTLRGLGMYSRSAENLLIGTAVQESGLTYLRQLGGGPAHGIYQIEPNTHQDIWENYLNHRPEMGKKVIYFASLGSYHNSRNQELIFNLAYATAICRIHYRRVKAPLPDADDVAGLARYWKRYYNTHLGHGTEQQFMDNYHSQVLGMDQEGTA